MSVQVSLVGLGQISASIGMALAEHAGEVSRIAYDRDIAVLHQAENLGVADSYTQSLPKAIEPADWVILAEPLEWMRTTLEEIKPGLQPGAILIDLSPCKTAIAQQIAQIYPEKIEHTSLMPAISGAYLDQPGGRIDSARKDLFRGSVVAITTSEYSTRQAFEAANRLVEWIGAAPLYASASEVDGWLAAVQLLPQVGAAALVTAVQGQSGWRESQKFASSDYSPAAAILARLEGEQQFGTEMLANRENLLRLITAYLSSLQNLRDALEASDAGELDRLLNSAREEVSAWQEQRKAGRWQNPNDVALPSFSLHDFLLGNRSRRKTP